MHAVTTSVDGGISILAQDALLNFQGKRADSVWTGPEASNLYEHLHNDNEKTHWIMGFRKDGQKHYRRSKRHPVQHGISWAWNSIVGKVKPGTELAFVPYSSNKTGQSRWGAMDFDAHDGDMQRARTLAFAAFIALLNEPNLALILESTGSGGWHLWAIDKVFHPINAWVKLLKTVALQINARLVSGTCEIFPPDSPPSEFGLGLRAPGCWNPGANTVSEIYWQNTQALLASLSGKYRAEYTGHFPDKRKKFFSHNGFQLQEEKDDIQLYTRWAEDWAARYAITLPGTRNLQLCKLAGEMFFQVGFAMGKRIATAQFQEKAVTTDAKLSGHIEDFIACWRGLEKCWVKQLRQMETDSLAALATENERDAFRIVWSYARYAASDGRRNFPIARDNLSERLGVSGPGAGWTRRKFSTLRIIELSENYQPNKRAARYSWLLRPTTDFSFEEIEAVPGTEF